MLLAQNLASSQNKLQAHTMTKSHPCSLDKDGTFVVAIC